jgi:hypothetical protein
MLYLNHPFSNGRISIKAGRELQHDRKCFNVGYSQSSRRMWQNWLNARLDGGYTSWTQPHTSPSTHLKPVMRHSLKMHNANYYFFYNSILFEISASTFSSYSGM